MTTNPKNKPEQADSAPIEEPQTAPETPSPADVAGVDLSSIATIPTANADESAKLREDNAKLKDQLLRALAEAENLRRRAAKETEDAVKYGITKIARDLISVLENLMRAEESFAKIEQTEAIKSVLEGVSATKRELVTTFERYGIKRIDPKKGDKFDHNIHQAVAQVPTADFEAGAIVDILQAGYLIHDRLLRPAMVAVAKAAE